MGDIHNKDIGLITARLFQRGKLGDQHLRLEEVAFTRFQAGFDSVEIALQVNETQVVIALTQNVAITIFQS